MKTLTSISKHSDWLDSIDILILDKWNLHRKRVNFGKQPLAVYQFVPCKLVDGKWVVLEEPCAGMYGYDHVYKEYQKALDKVLFEGCVLMDGWCLKLPCGYLLGSEESLNFRTIEDLVTYNLPLTKTALKEIGL